MAWHKFAPIHNRLSCWRVSTLHLATILGQEGIVRWILENGAKVDAKEEGSGKTPLHFATHGGNIEIVSILAEYGAEVFFHKSSMDDIGMHPIHYAAANGDKELIDFFLKNPLIEVSSSKRRDCSLSKLTIMGNLLDIS